VELRIREGRLVDKDELFEEPKPRILKIRKALEAALATGRVPGVEIDRIAWIMKEASEGIVEDGPEARATGTATRQGGEKKRSPIVSVFRSKIVKSSRDTGKKQ
jgi:hypothetical protein